jgi:hypothetical protein
MSFDDDNDIDDDAGEDMEFFSKPTNNLFILLIDILS